MKCLLIKTQKLDSTIYRYYLTETVSSHFSNIVVYGVGIKKSDEDIVFVNDVDSDKERIVEFIKELADGCVLPENLKEICEDYVDMLEFRGIVKWIKSVYQF